MFGVAKWIWVTEANGEKCLININLAICIMPDKCGSKISFDNHSLYCKETSEQIYPMMGGSLGLNPMTPQGSTPVTAMIRSAIARVVEDLELYQPQQRTKAIGDSDLKWSDFIDQVLKEFTEGDAK